MKCTILAINPGSTSMKIALFESGQMVFSADLGLKDVDFDCGDAEKIVQSYIRKITEELQRRNFDIKDVDVYVGRGGKMAFTHGGIYEINDLLREANKTDGKRVHPLRYSLMTVDALNKLYGGKAYILNSQTVDEFELTSRVTGYFGVWRKSAIHALNQKEAAYHAAKELGKPYEELNLVVAHLGGGISIVAHKQGKMVDSSGSGGEGPMSPTRSGTVACADVIQLAFSGQYTEQDLIRMTNIKGGLTAHLGTEDARRIEQQIKDGDEYAKLVYDAMIYQISKYIGAMAVSLDGKADAVVLTGGLANSDYVVRDIRKRTEWIAPVMLFPGEYEMEAFGSSAYRAVCGEDKVNIYNGESVFDSAKWMRKRRTLQ